MRPGWLARSLPRRKGLARSLPSMLAAQQSARARRVRLHSPPMPRIGAALLLFLAAADAGCADTRRGATEDPRCPECAGTGFGRPE